MRSRLLFALASLFTSSAAFAQTTWYVDVNAMPPGNGTLATPYADLQFALAQASTVSGDTLLVAPGTYFGGFDFLGKDVVVQSTGGAALTILDGQGSWPPPPTQGSPDPSPQQTVVSFTHGESAAAVLDGFTVQHGRGTQTVPPFGFYQGGGLYAVNASPTLRNLVVKENRAVNGGGAYFVGSTSLVQDCSFHGNTSTFQQTAHNGFGLYTNSAITVQRCTFTNNTGFLTGNGGGAFASAGTFTDCFFQGNLACRGGGAFVLAGGPVTFTDCRFEANTTGCDGSQGTGGGVFGGTLVRCEIVANRNARQGVGAEAATLIDCLVADNTLNAFSTASPVARGAGTYNCTLQNCEVRGNRIVGSTGAILGGGTGAGVYGGTATGSRIHHNLAQAVGSADNLGWGGGGAADATLVDCDVHDNVVEWVGTGTGVGGGGLRGGSATGCRFWGNQAPHGAGAANASLARCTLSGNVATIAGGGIACSSTVAATASARNSILWGNVPDQAFAVTGTVSIEWSDVEGGFAGTGNINADPLFQSAANHDFHLLVGSPCIDAGDPTLTDPNGSRIDMGAFPFECGAHTYCIGKVNSLGCIPTAGFTGTAMFSGLDDFHVTGSSIRKNALGMLLWSRAADNAPFFNGTLCVGQPFTRIGIQNSGGTGVGPNCTGHFDFHFTHAYMTTRGIAPFDTIFAQWYMRDAANPDGTSVGLSDAVSFTVCP